ncbi:MAG: conjugal transfer protein TraG N-terminal domain-containing protein, partial [Gammaproteobacteria bacterium]|nr:conjugal transfer protein TraG N-terminal domain-containing protein [Gammaproteobacteria bacterium]
MGVQDYLSLYTILLGWQVYDGLWDILTQLGLVMLPFGFIAARCFLAPYLSMGAKDAGVVGARRFVFHTFTALFILMIAGVPMVHLDPQILHFKPDCSTDGRVLTPGNTGTTYDDVLPVPQDIKVPLLWYVVLAVSNGITDQAKEIISCQPVDLRALQNELNLTQIKDTELKTEISQFYSSCYLPAYNKFVSENSDQTLQQQIDDSLDTYGKDDIGWIGSRTFQNISGFYDSFYATKEVPNFASDSSDPHDQINSQVGAPDWGEPLCKTWWQDSRYGLRIRLLNEFDDQSKEALTKIYSGGDEVYVQDAVIRAVIMKSTNSGAFNRGYASEEDSKNGTMNAYGKWGAKGYTEKATLSEYPKIHILENMLPVLQAVILFAVIMLLALALPLSCYAPGFCVTASVFLFSITFCGFLWHAIS